MRPEEDCRAQIGGRDAAEKYVRGEDIRITEKKEVVTQQLAIYTHLSPAEIEGRADHEHQPQAFWRNLNI
jgi:hypothetical protein